MHTMIETNRLVKKYREIRALDGLNLNVSSGVIYGFLGPNGAGKTTTLRVLAGMVRPDSGEARIRGEEVRMHDRGHLLNIGVLPEEPSFYGWMTAIGYLRDFVAPLYGMEKQAASRRASEIIEMVGLDYAANRRIQGFSRGMRQRLGLAGALVHRPQVLLLDEPVSALDPAGRKDVLDLIDNLRGETTILLSTHILGDVERICDVIGIINQGKMVIEADREVLLSRYARPIIEIEIEDDLRPWAEKVRRMSFVQQVQVGRRVIRVQVKHIETAQHLLIRALSEADVLVNRFELMRPTLEDVFLQLTKGSDRIEILVEGD
jgi:ABC-2 type transport system ATP-binding protein